MHQLVPIREQLNSRFLGMKEWTMEERERCLFGGKEKVEREKKTKNEKTQERIYYSETLDYFFVCVH